MQKVQITTPGIKKALRNYNYCQSIAEFIWNGFDAKATTIDLAIDSNEIGTISRFAIIDNGYGIPYDQLRTKFMPFFESEKELDPDIQRNTSAVHGKNGVGRLTFFHFAAVASWETIYHHNGQNYVYEIKIDDKSLNTYTASSPQETNLPLGTTVYFDGIHAITAQNFDTDIRAYLVREFGWFLELNTANRFSITLNRNPFDYSVIVGEREHFPFQLNGTTFDIRYVRWNEGLNKEYSRYYYINSQDNEIGKETTTLNNKGDHFYHSIYIKSDYFDLFTSIEAENQPSLIGQAKSDETFKALIEMVDRFLRGKRKPFLWQYTDQLIADFEKDGAFPMFSGNEWDKFRRQELESVVRELYQVEPKIFSRLNIEQKKTFIHFLNLIIDVGEKDKLLDILDEIVNLDPSDRAELAGLLKTSKLSGIIKTIKLIEDRYKAIYELKELVFNPELRANEPIHIQKFIERHYWIFGEQYHLVTAAEPKFEEALRRYIYTLRGEKKDIQIDHPDKNREMDIFMVRQLFQNDVVSNIVVELKHPRIRLGEKELGQVKKYMRVILSQPEFNGEKSSWEFHLVGNDFDSHNYMAGELENNRHHGEKSLVYFVNNVKIYSRKWSDVFTDFELRHNFLYHKLKIQRENLIVQHESADQIVDNLDMNTAVQAPEVSIP